MTTTPVGDPRPAGQAGPAGDQRPAGDEGPAGDPREAGEAKVDETDDSDQATEPVEVDPKTTKPAKKTTTKRK